MNIIRSQGSTQPVSSTPASALRLSRSGGGGFDAAKVDRTRAAIAAGSYTVDPDLIARRVMADARTCATLGIGSAG